MRRFGLPVVLMLVAGLASCLDATRKPFDVTPVDAADASAETVTAADANAPDAGTDVRTDAPVATDTGGDTDAPYPANVRLGGTAACGGFVQAGGVRLRATVGSGIRAMRVTK